MIHRGIEIHNVAELVGGDGTAVVPPRCLPAFAERKVSPASFAACSAEGLWLTRIPDALRVTLNPHAMVNAIQATGAEFRFNLGSEQARFVLKSHEAPGIVEIYQGSFLVGWQVVGTEPTTITVRAPANLDTLISLTEQERLPFDARLTRVLLPWRPAVRLLEIAGDFTPPRREQTPARRYLAYGSSITHGSSAVRPSGTYAQRTAQLLGADLINLGFGGGAHIEMQMAEYIAARDDWDFATLETGINIGFFGPARFAAEVDRFIGTIARAHRDKWIFCTGVYTCGEEQYGWAAEYRAIVKATVERLDLPRLVYLDGRALLPSVSGLTADLVHPSPVGMEELGRNLATAMRRGMGE